MNLSSLKLTHAFETYTSSEFESAILTSWIIPDSGFSRSCIISFYTSRKEQRTENSHPWGQKNTSLLLILKQKKRNRILNRICTHKLCFFFDCLKQRFNGTGNYPTRIKRVPLLLWCRSSLIRFDRK